MNKTCACSKKTIIGRQAEVKFLEFETLDVITAKIDTGAYTGALHVEDIKEEDGILSFRPISKQHPVVHVHQYRRKWVKPTTGQKINRYVIVTPVEMNGIKTEFELTLANRALMKYELLVGRKNIANKFLVDVSL